MTNKARQRELLMQIDEIRENANDYNELYKKLTENKEKYLDQLNKLYWKSLEIKYEVQVLRIEYTALMKKYHPSRIGLDDYEKQR